MKNGKFVFSRVGSDEVIGEVENSNGGYGHMARIYLSKGNIKNPDPETVGYLAAFIAAEHAGIEGIELGNPRNITEESIARMRFDFDVLFVTDLDDDTADENVGEEGSDVNPTATSDALS